MADRFYAVGELWLWVRGRRRRLRVSGESMAPTLEPGQFVLYQPGAAFDVGDVVVARHPVQPIEIVKRVTAIDSIGLVELSSDNAAVGSDSRTFGRIETDRVVGTVTISLEWPFPAVAVKRRR